MYLLYNVALSVATVLLLPWVMLRSLRGRLPGVWERLGFFQWDDLPPGAPVVWIHAVSLGEVKAAAALVRELKSRIPAVRIVTTASTRTGWNAARELAFPGDCVLFPPWDLPSVCRHFLHRIRPDAVVVFETELWPNLFRESKRWGAALVIANGRISDRTFPRYHATRLLWSRVLAWPDRVFAQSRGDAERFEALGVPAAKIQLAGNLKFASRPSPAPIVETLREQLRRDSGIGPVIVAGSTMLGEEQFLLAAYQELVREFPRLWMILAPRHPERFAEVREQVRALGIPLQVRSEWSPESRPLAPGVLVLDAMGELGAMYEIATVAFVGGTLVPTGGHNILEPASFARPIVIGPSMHNFQEIADEFLTFLTGNNTAPPSLGEQIRVGAIVQINDAAMLVQAFRHLFQNPDFSRRLGEGARERAGKHAQCAAAIADDIVRLLPRRSPSPGRVATVPQREVLGAGKTK